MPGAWMFLRQMRVFGATVFCLSLILAGASEAAADESKEVGHTAKWHIWVGKQDNGPPYCSAGIDLGGGRSFEMGKFGTMAGISLRVMRQGWNLPPDGDVMLGQTYANGDAWRLAMGIHQNTLIGPIGNAEADAYLASFKINNQMTIAFAVDGQPAWLGEQPWVIDIDDGARLVSLFQSCISAALMPAATGPAISSDKALPPARLPAPAFQPFADR